MSTVLVINAHPLSSSESKTEKVLEVFLNAYKQKHSDDELIMVNLFEKGVPEVDAELLHAWNVLNSGGDFNKLSASQQKKVAAFNDSTAQFLSADKVIIANPLWNLNIPTRLKAWFDTISVAGKTFHYTASGPEPLTSGKKALHIQSAGGTYNNQDFASQYVKAMLNFVGVADVAKISIEGIDYDPNLEDETMEAAFAAAKEVAEVF